MSKELDFEVYLSITNNFYGIYVVDKKKSLNIYKKEINISNSFDKLNIDKLIDFLNNNIFIIEKLVGKFVENIIVIIENKKILRHKIGFKKKNYENTFNEKYLENILLEANDLFKKTYSDNVIMHILIDRYIINGESSNKFIYNKNIDQLCLELNFISIPRNFVYEIDKVLERYQIKSKNYIDQKYILDLFKDEKMKLFEILNKIRNDYNENEVVIIEKNPKKLGIFEKFFQLFS